LPNLAAKPIVVAEEGMLLGDCAIESNVGTVDLGIRAQLGEIERGFFDRAGTPSAPESRPADSAAREGSHTGTRT
jgi:flagellar assembly protein FliH